MFTDVVWGPECLKWTERNRWGAWETESKTLTLFRPERIFEVRQKQVIPASQSFLLRESPWWNVRSEDDCGYLYSNTVAEYGCHTVLATVLELVTGVNGRQLWLSNRIHSWSYEVYRYEAGFLSNRYRFCRQHKQRGASDVKLRATKWRTLMWRSVGSWDWERRRGLLCDFLFLMRWHKLVSNWNKCDGKNKKQN